MKKPFLCKIGLHSDWELLQEIYSEHVVRRMQKDNKLPNEFFASKIYQDIKYQKMLQVKVCLKCSKLVNEIQEFQDFLFEKLALYQERKFKATKVYLENTTSPIVYPEQSTKKPVITDENEEDGRYDEEEYN